MMCNVLIKPQGGCSTSTVGFRSVPSYLHLFHNIPFFYLRELHRTSVLLKVGLSQSHHPLHVFLRKGFHALVPQLEALVHE